MSVAIRAVIIEDEKKSISILKTMLDALETSVLILGTAGTISDSVSLINKMQPELVFMDIHLLDGSSFDIIEHTDYSNYEVIFITAYHQHALKAFDIAAIHYLMKPIRKEHLAEAIERYQEKKYEVTMGDRLKVMNGNVNSETEKIILPLSDGLSIVRLEEIIRCESTNNYTNFYFTDGRQLVVSRPINFYEQVLSELNFCRIHAKHLINLKYVDRYVKGRGGYVVLHDNTEVDVSVSKRREFLNQLNGIATGY